MSIGAKYGDGTSSALSSADPPKDAGVWGDSGEGVAGNGIVGTTDAGTGVHGMSTDGTGVAGGSVNGDGVFGTSVYKTGVTGESATSGTGVAGISANGTGVAGTSTKGTGVAGMSTSGTGVAGTSGAENGPGVAGIGTGLFGTGVTGTSEGLLGGTGVAGTSGHGTGVTGAGVVGVEGVGSGGEPVPGAFLTAIGVSGRDGGKDARGIGVQGLSTAGTGVLGTGGNLGVSGQASGANGVGIYGKGPQYAGQFDGVVQVNGNANITGNVTIGTPPILSVGGNLTPLWVGGHANITGDVQVGGDVILPGADCAEDFDLLSDAEAEPGTVMVIGDCEALSPSSRPYDRRVAGVVSGAGVYKPALLLDRRPSAKARSPVALVGKVYCKVDAQYRAIDVGDLLTTSSTPGHAMKADDPVRAFGAIIGKALRPLESGKGLIPILVALQ